MSDTIACVELLERIGRSWDGLQGAVGGLDDERLAAPGPDGWSIKDHLAHVAAWEAYLLGVLDGADSRAALGIEAASDTDEENEIIRRRYAAMPAAEVRRLLADTHARTVRRIEALGDRGLSMPFTHYQPGTTRKDRDSPIAGWVGGNTCEHYEEHRSWILALAGR